MKKISSLFSCLLVLLCIGCGKNIGDAKKYDININADENIEVKTYIDYEKESLIVYLTNNNDYNIGSFDMNVNYYDKDGNNIGNDDNMALYFIKGGNYIMTLDLPKDEDYNYIIPDKIDLSVEIDQEYQDIVGGGKLYNDKIEVGYKKLDTEVEVNLKNNSGVELSTVEVAVLFMKDGRPIYVEGLDVSFDIEESDTITIDIPEDWEKSEKLDEDVLIDFDSIEIVVNRATTDY